MEITEEMKRAWHLERIFDLTYKYNHDPDKLRAFFESKEWTSYDIQERLEAIEYYFTFTCNYVYSGEILTEIVREIEKTRAQINNRKCHNIIRNEKIDKIVDTDYDNIYVCIKKYAEAHVGNAQAAYDLLYTLAKLKDYHNVQNGLNDTRTNEVRLNLFEPSFYFTNRDDQLLHDYQPIEYYAKEEAEIELQNLFGRLAAGRGENSGYQTYKHNQKWTILEQTRPLIISKKTKEEVKQQAIDILKKRKREIETISEAKKKAAYITFMEPQLIKR